MRQLRTSALVRHLNGGEMRRAVRTGYRFRAVSTLVQTRANPVPTSWASGKTAPQSGLVNTYSPCDHVGGQASGLRLAAGSMGFRLS